MRRKGRRNGVYAGLVLLGIQEHCTPWLGALVSAWSALLSSFEEVHLRRCTRSWGSTV